MAGKGVQSQARTMKRTKKNKIWKCCGKKYEKYRRYLRHRRKNHPEAVAKAKHSAQMQNYGQSGKEFDTTLKKQRSGCAVCTRKAKNVSLSQDHTHFIAKLKVVTVKEGKFWVAHNQELGFVYRSRTRRKAKRQVILKLKRASRRGVLCWHCNSALRKFLDNYELLIKAGEYLKQWSKKQGWEYVKDKEGNNCIYMKGKLIKRYSGS